MAITQVLVDLTTTAAHTGKRLPSIEARVVAITDVPPGCDLRISFDGHSVNPIRVFNPRTFTFPAKTALNVHVYHTTREADADPEGDTSRRYVEILFTDGEMVENGGAQRVEVVPAPADQLPIVGQFLTTGTAIPIEQDVACEEVQIKASADNASPITVGGDGVSATVDGTGDGDIVDPGERIGFAVPRSGLVSVNGPAGMIGSYKILPRRK